MTPKVLRQITHWFSVLTGVLKALDKPGAGWWHSLLSSTAFRIARKDNNLTSHDRLRNVRSPHFPVHIAMCGTV